MDSINVKINVKLPKRATKEELTYDNFDDLKKLASNIASAKLNCKNIVESLEKENASSTLTNLYKKDILSKIEDVFGILSEELNKYNLI